jgi:hypothetical protein
MQRVAESIPMSSSPAPLAWAVAFFARGWRGYMPWVVVQRVWRSRNRAEQFFRQNPGGFAFGLVSYRVLHAPMFDVFAPDPIARGIVDAIREYPARRAAQFAALERPRYAANGYPAALLEQMAPRPSEPLNDQSFRSPLLLVTAEMGSNRYTLHGAATTFDAVLESLVAHGEVKVDQAVALMILLTCHGKPGDAWYETRDDGSSVLHRGDLDSAFTQPFHRKRFNQVQAAIRVRSADDSLEARRSELNQLLSVHIPRVVASLRRNPPRAGRVLHSVARSRLAELVSEELGLARSRATRIPWWRTLDEWPERERRGFFRSLTAAQRAVVHAMRRGTRLPEGPSTPRVHLSRAKAKFDGALHVWRRSPT